MPSRCCRRRPEQRQRPLSLDLVARDLFVSGIGCVERNPVVVALAGAAAGVPEAAALHGTGHSVFRGRGGSDSEVVGGACGESCDFSHGRCFRWLRAGPPTHRRLLSRWLRHAAARSSRSLLRCYWKPERSTRPSRPNQPRTHHNPTATSNAKNSFSEVAQGMRPRYGGTM